MKESKTNSEHNEYYLFGDRPVMFVAVDDEPARQVLKYDWDTGFFVPGPDYVHKILFGKDEVEELGRAEFIAATEALRRRDFAGENPAFALYQLVEAIFQKARSENRPLTEEETALIRSLDAQTYDMFEDVSISGQNHWKKQAG